MTYDITNGLTFILNEILKIFQYCFNLLDSITFNGFSLLDFSITIIVFSAIIPVLISSINAYNSYNEKRQKEERKRRKEESKQ